MRVCAGCSDAFREQVGGWRGRRNLSRGARRLSPDWGRKLYYDGWLPVRAWGEQEPESRPTVSPAELAIAFHRSDPDLAANFGGKLVGLCVRTLWAPPLPVPR